jgi:hypothetical protein
MPGEVWKPLAVPSAIVSTVVITLFFDTRPMFIPLAAMGMNVAGAPA